MTRKVSKTLELVPGAAPDVEKTAGAYRPFPVEALPAAIGCFVRQGALALGCDAAHLALPALAVAASAVGITRTLRLKVGWDEPCILWTAVVGEDGWLKSPARSLALASLYRWHKALVGDFRGRSYLYRQVAQRHHADARAKREYVEPCELPPRPILERLVCTDTAVEAVAAALEDSPRGTLVVRSDLAGWLDALSCPAARRSGRELAAWRETHLGGTLHLDRRPADQGQYLVPRAAASLTGAVRAADLARVLTPGVPGADLASRLLLAMPPQMPRVWSEVVVEPEAEEGFRGMVDRLLALDWHDRDRRIPHALTLSPEARAAWVTFYDAWGKEQAGAGGTLAAALSKLEAYAARLALLHHVAEYGARRENDVVPVSAESLSAGVTLCRWFAAEARRIYGTLLASAEERGVHQLVQLIEERGGRITARGLMRVNSRRYPDFAAAQFALAKLVESGLGRWVEDPAKMAVDQRSGGSA